MRGGDGVETGFEGQIHIDMGSVKEIASLHLTLWMSLELSILQYIEIHLACQASAHRRAEGQGAAAYLVCTWTF